MHTNKAIFFDLDETLIKNKLSVSEVFGSVYKEFENELGTENGSVFFTEFSAKAKQMWNSMFEYNETPEHQLVKCYEHSIASTNSVSSNRQYSLAQEMFEHFLFLSTANVSFQDNAENVLSELESMGFITGIITNGFEALQLSKITKLDLQHQVKHITVSAQARAHKPLKPVFELALERANVSASESVMVGDHPTNDVAGAIRAGLTGVYYNPNQHSISTTFAELTERPDHVIKHLDELRPLLI